MKNKFGAMKAPEHCDNCGSINVKLTDNSVIYGKSFGKWSSIYYCYDCKAAVACHNGTEIPMGKMADRATRALRTKAHEEFDKLWQSGLISRSKAYNLLADELQIDREECHLSWLTADQLKDAITISADYLKNNSVVLTRRKQKQDEKQKRRIERYKSDQRRSIEEIRKRKTKLRQS